MPVPVPHKYLIETNPALTDLKQFMGSDYLLGNLGYDPDQAQKRLGDGLYEQRLIREAVVARTGQRYLAGLTSDEAMYRYLMDNAIASKDALGLSLGVTLSAEQVAALTHDIVWLEEYEVNGELVLVPVLYLAQAEGRLAANGALIQGRDVTLISGGDLSNQGTLRASGDLDVQAVNIANSGLMEANERLSLLAEDSIRNAQGGIIAGRDVSLLAGNDILNERSVSVHQSAAGNREWISSFADSAARIEASGDLSLAAGRDVINLGGVLDSRGDMSIASVQDLQHTSRGSTYLNEQISQLGAEVSAGRDLEIGAGRDLGIIGSELKAGRDLGLQAAGDVTIASAADESHFYSKSKKVTRQEDHVQQQASELSAGGSLGIVAGQDLNLISSRISANDEAYLVAGGELNLLAAQDEHYSYYLKKKTKSGVLSSSSKTTYSASGQTLARGSLVSADTVTLQAGSDLRVHGSDVVSTEQTTLRAGNDITEDDPMVMRLNVEYLARLEGVELVGQCESVPAALELLEREAVDLLLLDVYLRNRSGLEVLRHLRAQDRNTDAVLITAASEIETVRVAQRLGARDYLVKPFSFERFRDAVEACRRAREALSRLPDQLGQGDIDRLFSQPPTAELRRPGDLPKGLTPASLTQVVQAILALDEDSFTSETLLPATGMSRVSVRKYLKHLSDAQLLEESFHYGQIGRPSFRYRCLDRAALQRLAQG